jgi:PIN domain nuclease of toxin-antitoxin system
MRKIIIGILFVMMVAGGSVTIAFADQNIAGMLTEWFDRQTEASMEEIEDAIAIEQEKQTEKLQAELRLAIEAAEQEMDAFVEAEKISRVEEIREYANQLMEEIEVDESDIKEAKLEELDQILEEAKAAMDQVIEAPATEKESEETTGEKDE